MQAMKREVSFLVLDISYLSSAPVRYVATFPDADVSDFVL